MELSAWVDDVMPEGGVMPYAAAFANKASPRFQADWADAEQLKFALRDLDSICERAAMRPPRLKRKSTCRSTKCAAVERKC